MRSLNTAVGISSDGTGVGLVFCSTLFDMLYAHIAHAPLFPFNRKYVMGFFIYGATGNEIRWAIALPMNLELDSIRGNILQFTDNQRTKEIDREQLTIWRNHMNSSFVLNPINILYPLTLSDAAVAAEAANWNPTRRRCGKLGNSKNRNQNAHTFVRW